MSKYIEFVLACTLKQKIPVQIIQTLEMLAGTATDQNNFDWNRLPSHPLFAIDTEWDGLLQMSSSSFPGYPNTTIYYDDIKKAHELMVRSHVKWNEGEEIQKFLHWITPFVETDYYGNYPNENDEYYRGFVFAAYFRGRDDEHPTLIYFKDNRAYLSEVTAPELKLIEYS